MARVFVSYRRADGQYGVGWLGERLRSLDTVTGVETAFHDAALRCGDDFPDALEQEITGSDLVIAVIGPEWIGDQGGVRRARIEDPDDWVVRELATAFRLNTRVLPVLIGGAEHPLAAQVHESIAEIARLHTLPFKDGRDLDTIVEHVQSHLADLDADRARLAGLERPIEVPQLGRPWLIAAAAVVLAAAFAVLMRWSAAWGTIDPDGDCTAGRSGVECVQSTSGFRTLGVIMPLFGAYAGAIAAVGSSLAWRLAKHSTVRWRALIGTTLFVAATLGLLTFSSDSGHLALVGVPALPQAMLRFWANVAVTVVGALGVGFCVLAPVFSTPKADPHRLGDRVMYLAIARDAERWGAALLSAEFALVATAGAAVLLAVDQSGADQIDASPWPNVAFALVFSTLLITFHLWSITRLRDAKSALDRDLAELPPRYRRHAEPRLIARTFDDGGWGFRAVLASPLIVTAVAAVAMRL